MSRSWSQLLRPFVPNLEVRIRHVEQNKSLAVRCREHLGLIVRGTRAYESQYVDLLRGVIAENATVFDVGANIGFYTVLFSGWVGRRGKVVAFEPDPANLRLLRRNLELNRCENVVVRPVALTDTCGTQDFSVDHTTRMTGHLGNGDTYGATVVGKSKAEVISVTTSTLDDEVQRHGAPDVIKLDIEGGEYNALAGGAGLLQTRRPIIVSEMNSWVHEQEGIARGSQAAQYLWEHDYSLWNADSGREAQPDAIPWMVLAMPRDSQANRSDA